MKTTIKNSLYAIAGSSLLALNNSFAMDVESGGGKTPLNEGLIGSHSTADVVIQQWVVIITTFLYIISVIVILWAGFMILTASGDEEKTKKGKTIIIQASIGLLVIFIASSIIQWIIQFLFKTGA